MVSELQNQILQSVNSAMGKAIESELVGYNKPLSLLTARVIESHQGELFNVIDCEVSQLIGGDDFRSIIKEQLNKNLAKVLIQRMGGELEKQVNTLKQNPQTRARITLAISEIIESL